MSTEASPGRSGSLLGSGHPRPTVSAARDLFVVAVAVWIAAFVIHRFDVPEGLALWNRSHPEWAIDEVTLIALCAVAGLGVFSWRRWQESLRTASRHEATLQRLHTTEQEIAAKDQLIRTVSHELRTPLAAILGYAQMLGGAAERSPEREEMVATILRQGRDLSDIVEDLLTRAQSEARTLRVVSVPVNLTANVNQVLEAWHPEERDRMRVGGVPASAIGDPARVRQILRNLLTNAVRYGAGTIEITSRTDGDRAYLAVSDEGGGVSEADAERIFLPYQRADHAVPGSIGLGLAISRELARLMGGDLVYRRVDRHSVFELSLPRRQPEDAAA